MRVCVHIHNYLMQESGIVILRAQFQILFAHRDSQCRTDASIPRLLLVQVIINKKYLKDEWKKELEAEFKGKDVNVVFL